MSDLRNQAAILSVTDLTERIRENLEHGFPFVWVRGEVSNYRAPSANGHIYFSLKDSNALLQCVWFRHRQKGAGATFDPLTGEVYDTPRPNAAELLNNGQEFLCAGAISLYAPRGQYQMIVEFALPAGEGCLAQAFEARKRKLAALGYFDEERKRRLPELAERVALVASPQGAAIHDFLELAGKRGLGAKIRLFPVPAQGEGAAEKIAAAIEQANALHWAQVIVLIRGGGSLEDLWAFNEECLASAVFNSRLPVVAGIGHEIDFTLADMTADKRAATPSHAAQVLWPLRRDLWQRLDDLETALDSGALKFLERLEERLASSRNALNWLSPARKLDRMREQLANLAVALEKEKKSWFMHKSRALESALDALRKAWRPAEKMEIAERNLDWLVKSLDRCAGTFFSQKRRVLADLGLNLEKAANSSWHKKGMDLALLEASLKNLDPLAPLERGYTLLYRQDRLLRSITACEAGDLLEGRLADGLLSLKVEGKKGFDDETNTPRS